MTGQQMNQMADELMEIVNRNHENARYVRGIQEAKERKHHHEQGNA